jgi:hypothetical protein
MHSDHERMDDGGMDGLRALLETLDHPVPPVSAESIADRARRRSFTGVPRWAAAILLTLAAAGAAFAIPGSPVRGWVAEIAAGPRRSPPQPRAGPIQGPAETGASAGIAVAPGQALIIELTGAGAGGLARVSLADGAEVVVRAPAGAARFTSEADRLLIERREGQDTFAIEIPRTASRVEIRLGGKRVLLAQAGRVTSAEPAGADGVYSIGR